MHLPANTTSRASVQFAQRAYDPGKRLMYLFLAGFMLITPMSLSEYASLEDWEWLKWARVSLLVVMGILYLNWYRTPALKTLSGKLLLFGVVFTIAALWSTSVIWGLLFKSMYLATLIVGFSLANMLKTEIDFRIFLRIMTITGLLALAGCVAWILSADPLDNPLFWKGRLQLLQLNANLLAQTAVVFALLSGFHLLMKDSTTWSFFAIVVISCMNGIVLLSGSRSALLVLLVSFLALSLILRERRVQFIALIAISLLGFFFVGDWAVTDESVIFTDIESASSDLRITEELTKDTRLQMWQSILNKSMKEPVIGIGWMHFNNRWTTTQSVYLQILLETGIFGVILYGVFVISALASIWKLIRKRRFTTDSDSIRCFVFCITLVAILIHGISESTGVTGASPVSLVLALCCGQIDRFVAMSMGRSGTPRVAFKSRTATLN
jgi:O-antigen ligase